MSLDVKILGLDQKSSVDFNDGSVTQANFLQIELPTGEVVLALVDDGAAQKILMAVQMGRKVFREQPAPAAPSVSPIAYTPAPRQAAAPSAAFEFGGDGEQGASFGDEEDEPVVPPNFGPQLAKVRLPDADEKGNPIDANGNLLVDRNVPQEPEAESDEDGVRGL